MEVAGSKPEEEETTMPTVKQDRLCQPCDGDGDWILASGYCRQCNEFICNLCIKFHRKNKAIKWHEIVEGDDIPETPVADEASDDLTITNVDSYETCKVHSSDCSPATIKFYCVIHDRVGCAECMLLDHTYCKSEYINDVAKAFNFTKGFDSTQRLLAVVDNKVVVCKTAIQQVYKANENADLKALEDIRELKMQIVTYIEEKEQEMMQTINNKKTRDVKDQKAQEAECSKATDELDNIRKELVLLETGSSTDNKYFTVLKRVNTLLHDIEERIDGTKDESLVRYRKYTFQRDTRLVEILKSKKPLGTLQSEMDIAKASAKEAKTKGDKRRIDRAMRKLLKSTGHPD